MRANRRLGCSMGRARKTSEANLYHVVSRGVGGQIIFEDDSDRRHFLALLKRATCDYGIKVAAWCLMNNHFHLVIGAQLEEIAKAMQWLKSRYAYDANKRYQRDGHLFQSVYASYPIEDESYLAAAVAYIHDNPVRAGIVQSAFEYLWSSAREYNGELFIVDPYLMPDLGLEVKPGPFTKRLLYAGGVMSDDDASALAKAALGIASPTEIRAMGKDRRNESVRILFGLGVKNNQIARITGVPPSTVSAACKQADKG